MSDYIETVYGYVRSEDWLKYNAKKEEFHGRERQTQRMDTIAGPELGPFIIEDRAGGR